MEHKDIWDTAAAESYDTPGAGMFAPEVVGPAVDCLADLAAGGAALELAIGTGRIALPLHERGVPVSGIDISPAMVTQLRKRAGADTIPVVIGNMTTATAEGRFTLVFLVFNGISNVLTQADQIACFRNAARHLEPGGRFVIELEVTEPPPRPPAPQVRVFANDRGYIGLDVFDVANQLLVSHHFRFGEGTAATLFRSPHRYASPGELDMMAVLAGFTLESRQADWSGTPFDAVSPSHVSVYRLPR